jgi:hypothetical protein
LPIRIPYRESVRGLDIQNEIGSGNNSPEQFDEQEKCSLANQTGQPRKRRGISAFRKLVLAEDFVTETS